MRGTPRRLASSDAFWKNWSSRTPKEPAWKVTSFAMRTMARPWGYSRVLRVTSQASMPTSLVPSPLSVSTSSILSQSMTSSTLCKSSSGTDLLLLGLFPSTRSLSASELRDPLFLVPASDFLPGDALRLLAPPSGARATPASVLALHFTERAIFSRPERSYAYMEPALRAATRFACTWLRMADRPPAPLADSCRWKVWMFSHFVGLPVMGSGNSRSMFIFM
mmetsp:Transcript_3079/g.9250  ORF Transcript_3079/g.9250 Transcript_3079/m.9250 type:complete len:221 (-) Transcript_3079:1143-1805(-)